MKTIRFIPRLSSLLASLCLVLPATGLAEHHGHGSHGFGHFHGGSHFVSYRSHSGYYSSGRYGYYRPYYYDYPYYSPYSSFGFSYYSSPRYYSDYSYSVPRYDSSGALTIDVQRALRRNGYYRGDLDGDIGPESRAAIRRYQYDRGLRATGRIDNALLRSLRIG